MADIFNMTDTWNDGTTTFTAIKMNVTDTASDASSKLLDLQVGGVSQFSVDKTGVVEAPERVSTPFIKASENNNVPEIVLEGQNNGRRIIVNSRYRFDLIEGFVAHSQVSIGFVPSGPITNTPDLRLWRDDANALGLRNGINAQSFNIYNTYTDASNYERGVVRWSADVFEIKPEAAGTGTVRELHISGLPTSNPGPGILWNDAGTVKVGT